LDVEPFHLAELYAESAHADASDRLGSDPRDEQPASRRSVFTRKVAQLALELLEREVEAERRRVLLEQRSNRAEVVLASLDDLGYALQATSPATMVAATTGPPRWYAR
jgi:hypothetical protein